MRHVVAAKADETELTRGAMLKLDIDLAFIRDMGRSFVRRHDRFLEVIGRLGVVEGARGWTKKVERRLRKEKTRTVPYRHRTNELT